MSDSIDQQPDSGRKPRRHRIVITVVAVIVVLAAAVLMFRWWEEDRGFCHRVSALPDIAGSVRATDSPSKGMLAYASALDGVAEAAPDDATKAAAQALAQTQRSIGQALSGDSIDAAAPAAIAALDTPTVQQAEGVLQQTIERRCSSD